MDWHNDPAKPYLWRGYLNGVLVCTARQLSDGRWRAFASWDGSIHDGPTRTAAAIGLPSPPGLPHRVQRMRRAKSAGLNFRPIQARPAP